jgi:BTB/POZ domain
LCFRFRSSSVVLSFRKFEILAMFYFVFQTYFVNGSSRHLFFPFLLIINASNGRFMVKMSSQQQLGLSTPLGEVDHVRALSDNFASLLISENYHDITLLVEGQKIPAHKVILASRSEYFR